MISVLLTRSSKQKPTTSDNLLWTQTQLGIIDYLLVGLGCVIGFGLLFGVLPTAATTIIGISMLFALIVSLDRGFFYSLGVWWAYAFFNITSSGGIENLNTYIDVSSTSYNIYLGPILLEPGDLIGIGFLLAAIFALLKNRYANDVLKSYPHRTSVFICFFLLILIAAVSVYNGYITSNPGFSRPLRSILTVSPLIYLLISRPPTRLIRGFTTFLPLLAVAGIIIGFLTNRSGTAGGIIISSIFLFPLLIKKHTSIILSSFATALGILCTKLLPYITLSTFISVLSSVVLLWTNGLVYFKIRKMFLLCIVAGLIACTAIFFSLLRDIEYNLISPHNTLVYTGSFNDFLSNPVGYAQFKFIDRAYIYSGAIHEIIADPFKLVGGRSYFVINVINGGYYVEWGNYAHNFALEVFIEFGLLTGLPFIYLSFRACLDAWNYLSRNKHVVCRESLFLSCFVISLVIWLFFYNYALVPSQGFLLWLPTGIIVRSQYEAISHHKANR